MTPLALGIHISAYVGVILICGATLATIYAFIKAQTMLLKAAFLKNKNPNHHLHPYTRSILSGTCPELRMARKAIACGDTEEAEILVDEICQLLEAENDDSMRKQLQSKLKKALKQKQSQSQHLMVLK